MILSTRCPRPRPGLRLTRAMPDPAPRRPAPPPGTLYDPDWAIREIVEAVASAPAR
ncbi:MAG: hypothetical protein KDK28_04840 [Maritimibacter sp.]|nr:hypothetical protein [Maritimibacter sp.]